jgi:hypothetical protein
VAETGLRCPQHQLAQNSAMGVHEHERGVVADRTDVAQMVCETFELGHQPAQVIRPRRRLDVQCRLNRSRKGGSVSHGAIPGGARRKPRATFERRPRH